MTRNKGKHRDRYNHFFKVIAQDEGHTYEIYFTMKIDGYCWSRYTFEKKFYSEYPSKEIIKCIYLGCIKA